MKVEDLISDIEVTPSQGEPAIAGEHQTKCKFHVSRVKVDQSNNYRNILSEIMSTHRIRRIIFVSPILISN